MFDAQAVFHLFELAHGIADAVVSDAHLACHCRGSEDVGHVALADEARFKCDFGTVRTYHSEVCARAAVFHVAGGVVGVLGVFYRISAAAYVAHRAVGNLFKVVVYKRYAVGGKGVYKFEFGSLHILYCLE